jgi:hypothetical protein
MADSIDTEQARMDAFLDKPQLLARVATVRPDGRPHLVPVWYLWEAGSLWISSFCSTRHVKNLLADARCAISIDEALGGVIFEGHVEILREPRAWVATQSEKIYTRYLGSEGVQAPEPQSWIYDDENLILKLTPEKKKVWGL